MGNKFIPYSNKAINNMPVTLTYNEINDIVRKNMIKEKERFKLEATRAVSDAIVEILEKALSNSYEWFRSEKHGEKRVRTVVESFLGELDKVYAK